MSTSDGGREDVPASPDDGVVVDPRTGEILAEPPVRDRETRWRLVLGGGDADGVAREDGQGVDLDGDDVARDAALEQLYGERRADLGRSAPRVARWLGDIRTYFPSSVVQVMQSDALTGLGLTRLLLEPELMRAVQPDVHLVSTLVGLQSVIPEESREVARSIVRRVTDDLEERLAPALREAVRGALQRAARTRRPRPGDIDWRRTVAANLKHYLPEHRTVVPERLVGYARRARSLERTVVLAVDQSGSMAGSVVYAGVFGAVLASLRSLRTHMVVFDTAVADLTDELDDPVDLLFGIQLGGGTDIEQAIAYCEGLVESPQDTVLVLLSDLFEGGDAVQLVARLRRLVSAGVTVVVLLALSDQGAPAYDRDLAEQLAAIGIPSFACTPDRFADLMATAIDGAYLGRWAAEAGLVTAAPVT